jgi:hypothetical protein
VSPINSKDSIYIRGLALFKNRTAYANIINDRSVPYHTAAISEHDPFMDMTRLNPSYLPGYAPVILDPVRPVIPLSKPKPPVAPSLARRFLFPIAIAFLVPLWATFFVLASLYQSYFSSRRIRQHFLLNSWQYDTEEQEGADPVLSEAVQEVFEDVVDNATLFSPEDQDDENFEDVSENTALLDGNGNANGHSQVNGSGKPVSFKREEYKLALTEEQVSMMNGLRSLSWQTFGVHIHHTSHSHAAMIMRTRWRRDLSEGETVIRHWLDGHFEV